MITRWIVSLSALTLLPAIVLAADGVQIPEASSSVLFALGALGVLVGRYASRKRQTKRKD